MDNLSIEDGADREMTMRSRMTRERSNGQVPTASRTALGRRSFSEVSRSALHTGDVLVAEDAAEDEEGEQSAWKVESILGEGAFSTVWSGKQVVRRLKGKAREEPQAEIWEAEDAERSVAIKVMDKRICRENDRTRISFVREVEVLKVRATVMPGGATGCFSIADLLCPTSAYHTPTWSTTYHPSPRAHTTASFSKRSREASYSNCFSVQVTTPRWERTL
jgi:serine/threonine protein kinase